MKKIFLIASALIFSAAMYAQTSAAPAPKQTATAKPGTTTAAPENGQHKGKAAGHKGHGKGHGKGHHKGNTAPKQ